jgi:hypothetical protein
MGHGNSASADDSIDRGEGGGGAPASEDPSWWKVALEKGLAGAAATNSEQQGSPIAPIAPITTGIIDRIKARRAAVKNNNVPDPGSW